MNPIRVMIVEDSAVVRELLTRIISRDARLEVAAAYESAEQALEVLERVSPDVISLDIRLPGMQGLEATRRIMSLRPTPIVVVAAISDDLQLTMEALKAGALAVVEKPAAPTDEEYAAVASRICTQLAIMSEVMVVRQRVPARAERAARRALPHEGPFGLLGIAASTGGPNALMELLSGLGKHFPLPIAVVQHMTPGFIEGFRAWLEKVTPFRVETVSGRTVVEPGRVYLAPSGRHLRVDEHCAWVEYGPPVGAHCPSATVLFDSMAGNLGPAGIGVLLTGMGEDGAEGLLRLRRAGSYTIVEDQSTAVVYGMPAAGARLGAALESLPLPVIASRVQELAGTARRTS
jgi:two-component system, chemotaxis family, protein-glutamate methylesterase/glutaminase